MRVTSHPWLLHPNPFQPMTLTLESDRYVIKPSANQFICVWPQFLFACFIICSSCFFKFYFFLLYNTVLVLPYINMNLPQVYTCSPPWTSSLFPPIPSLQYHASNLDWRFVSYMILYMFQCNSPKSPHPLPLPQSPKDCSIHRCLFCCLAYRIIVTIFLNSIYMH